ncbi:hypothetical protein PC111_g19214 [Phytophthora cactorum]|nr:hypothetical protein PC111_g19214 [Phytophthora cactorum]
MFVIYELSLTFKLRIRTATHRAACSPASRRRTAGTSRRKGAARDHFRRPCIPHTPRTPPTSSARSIIPAAKGPEGFPADTRLQSFRCQRKTPAPLLPQKLFHFRESLSWSKTEIDGSKLLRSSFLDEFTTA